MHWHVKDHGIKNIMPAVGMFYFTCTRFKNKEIKETAYLLDRVLGLLPHACMSDGVKAALLEEAVQTSYEKAGKEACPVECVSRETVMRHVRCLEIPAKSQEEPAVKKKTRILYVEADEDVKAMLFYSTKRRKKLKKTEEEICFSATEMITWEKKHRKANGKYIKALRASISNQISVKIFFNTAIAGL